MNMIYFGCDFSGVDNPAVRFQQVGDTAVALRLGEVGRCRRPDEA